MQKMLSACAYTHLRDITQLLFAAGMQCHFEPLTGEVVIASKAPPPQPAAKSLVRKQKKQTGACSHAPYVSLICFWSASAAQSLLY